MKEGALFWFQLTIDLVIALCGAGTMIPSLFFMPSVQRKGLTPRDQTPRDEENQQRGSEDQTINRESPSRSLSKILIFEDIIGEQLKKSQLTIGNRRQITGNKGPSFTFAILGRCCCGFLQATRQVTKLIHLAGLFFAFSSLYYGYHFVSFAESFSFNRKSSLLTISW